MANQADDAAEHPMSLWVIRVVVGSREFFAIGLPGATIQSERVSVPRGAIFGFIAPAHPADAS
jgi:hypothetical protein